MGLIEIKLPTANDPNFTFLSPNGLFQPDVGRQSKFIQFPIFF